MSSGRWSVLAGAAVGGLVTLCGLVGCDAAAAQRRELGSGNPLDRARGVVHVSEGHDAKAVHKLVDLLEDQDAAVRMYAILALQRLCGRDYGYHYYENESIRETAVERWRAALRSGELAVQPRGKAPAESAAPPVDAGVVDPDALTGEDARATQDAGATHQARGTREADATHETSASTGATATTEGRSR